MTVRDRLDRAGEHLSVLIHSLSIPPDELRVDKAQLLAGLERLAQEAYGELSTLLNLAGDVLDTPAPTDDERDELEGRVRREYESTRA